MPPSMYAADSSLVPSWALKLSCAMLAPAPAVGLDTVPLYMTNVRSVDVLSPTRNSCTAAFPLSSVTVIWSVSAKPANDGLDVVAMLCGVERTSVDSPPLSVTVI